MPAVSGIFCRSQICGIVIFLALAVRPALAETILVLESQPGDYVGGGIKREFRPADGQFKLTSNNRSFRISFNTSSYSQWWYLDFVVPEERRQSNTLFDGAVRAALATSVRPGLDISGNGRGCNRSTGRFLILEHVRKPTGGIERLAIDFEQHCEGKGPALFGAFRYKSDIAVTPRISVGDLVVRKGNRGRTTAHLVFSLSMPSDREEKATFATRDVTAFWARDYFARSGGLHFKPGETEIAVPVRILGNLVTTGDLEFAVDLRSFASTVGDGLSRVTIQDPNAPMTIMAMSSDKGDYIGGRQYWSFTPFDSLLTVNQPNWSGTNISFNRGDASGNARFKIAGKTLLFPTTYINAQRFPNDAAGIHGMDVSMNGRGCNTINGRFRIFRADYDPLNKLKALSLNFEQHCENQKPALYGSIHFNTRLRQASIADAVGIHGQARFVITLNPPSRNQETVTFETMDGTATAGADYQAVKQEVVFRPGQTQRAVVVPLLSGATAGQHFFGKLTSTRLPLWIDRSMARIKSSD